MNDPESRRFVTLKDIAKAVGLSRTAVAMALKNDRQIAESTRRRVQAQAKEMGYQPNSMAASLAHFRQDSKTPPIRAAIAWLNRWPDPKRLRSFRHFDAYWRGVSDSAEKFGYRLEELIWEQDAPLGRLEKILLARGINGILLPPQQGETNWEGMDWSKFSVVRLSRDPETPQVHTITSDQVENAMLAVESIVARGYRRVGFAAPNCASSGRKWLFEAGFLLAQLGMSGADRLPILQDPCADPRRLFRWIEREKPEAILTPCQELPGLLKEAGYRIPEDIAIASLNCLDGNVDAGIDQRPEEIGRVATSVLLSLLHENERGIPEVHREVLIKGKWVDGASLPRCASL